MRDVREKRDYYLQAINTKGRGHKCFMKAAQISQALQSEGAKEHLAHGFSRRMGIINSNFIGIISIADPQRTTPLSDDDRNELTLHLNSFYFHIRGALDNLAWCLAYEFQILGEVKEAENAFQAKVSLFGNPFQKGLEKRAIPFVGLLKALSDWWKEVKTFRDPVAHRIPLYAIPSVLSEAEATQYREALDRATTLLVQGNLEEAEILLDKAGGIGSYVPVFSGAFRPNSAPRPIYPQVTEDYANLIRIGDAIIDFLGRPRSEV
jgi:hypothetical protein